MSNDTFRLDSTRYCGRPLENRSHMENACYDFLDHLGISYFRADHDPAMTIELCHAVEKVLGTKICKNLFLCNRQKTDFYLLLIDGDKVFKTKFLSAQLGCSRLSFGEGEHMESLLKVLPGSASVLSLLNDKDRRVHLIIDRSVLKEEYFACHPCQNTSTLAFQTGELTEKILPALGHIPTMVDLPEAEDA